MRSKLEYALQLASAGFYIFPCAPDSGDPVFPWREISTRNDSTIIKWWSEDELGWKQNYNIGIDCFKSGLTVVDVDVKDNKGGRASFEMLEKEYGWPETYTVKTPSGGLHLYFKGAGYRNSTSKLAPGIDIRSDGGYVVAPYSTKTNGEYKIIKAIDIAEMPEWLKEKLASFRNDPAMIRKAGVVVREDNEEDIQWARDFLAEREPAVEGQGGDQHTFVTICMLKEHGIGPETALDLLQELWNPYCLPEWDEGELIEKINSAYKSAQNATGAKSAFAVFDVPPPLPAAPKVPRFNPGFVPRDSSLIKPRDWVFGDMALAKQVSMLIAMPGIGKSTFTLSMAISKITGRDLLGIDPRGQGAVAIFNNEDNMEEQERRIIAAMQYHGVNRDELNYPLVTERGSRLFLNGRENPMRIAQRLADGRLKAQDANPMIDYALENDIRLIIVDPFSMTHPAQENSNEEIMQIGMLYNHVAEKANCAVMLVHHTRKANTASSEGHSGNLDSARGASALGGLVRIAYTLDGLSSQEGKRIGISEHERRLYVMLEQAKANMSAPGIDRKYYKRHGEIIGRTVDNWEGESVGVLLPVTMKARAQDSMNEATQVLIKDIESLVEDKEMSIPDITRSLISSFSFHHDKKAPALSKAIYRLFSEGILTGFTGTLHVKEVADGGRNPSRFISLEKFSEVNSVV